MSKAMELFTDSYLRKLKRPELQREYDPDQTYGANTLFRSEETNPWAGRDASNAKYGYLGGSSGGQGGGVRAAIPALNMSGSGSGSNIMSSLVPQGTNLPTLPSQQKSTFANLMGPVAASMGKYGAKSITDWMNGPQNFEGLSPEMGGLVDSISKGGGGDIYSTLASQFGKEAPTGLSDLGGYEKLLGGAVEKSTDSLGELAGGGFDPTSSIAAAVPMLAGMFGLKGTGGNALGAAAGVGTAAAQGFLNPLSDIGAVLSLYKLFRGLF